MEYEERLKKNKPLFKKEPPMKTEIIKPDEFFEWATEEDKKLNTHNIKTVNERA